MKKTLFLVLGLMTVLGTVTFVHADDKQTPCTSIEQTQGVKTAGGQQAPAPVVNNGSQQKVN